MAAAWTSDLDFRKLRTAAHQRKISCDDPDESVAEWVVDWCVWLAPNFPDFLAIHEPGIMMHHERC